jgi:hypothetical protein
MYQAEVKYRQGWWVTQHDDEDAASEWINGRIRADMNAVNPVTAHRIIDLEQRMPLPYPEVPFFNAEELLKDEGFWNK